MAFYFSRRKLKVREPEESGELNIVPYLDILINLIMFMLMSITGLAALGILNVSAPSYGGAPPTTTEGDDQPKLVLSVLVSKDGFYVAGANAVLGQPEGEGLAGKPTIPRRADGKYDFPTLTAQMVKIKQAFPKETRLILGAEAAVEYETLIQTMDAVRDSGTGKGQQSDLFPDVTLAAL